MDDSMFPQLMIPDVLTPAQYYEGVAGAHDAAIRPVKRLMLAVLEDAIRCYQTYRSARFGVRRQIFAETEVWLWDRKADSPFAFETICDTLGINAECLRRSLRKSQQPNGTAIQRLVRRSPVVRASRLACRPKRRRPRRTADAGGDGSVAA